MDKLEKDKFREKLTWIKGYKKDIEIWTNMLLMLNLMKDEVKLNGLSSMTLETFEHNLKKSNIKINTPALKEVYIQIQKYLSDETQKLSNSPILGCSDRIESIFGKYKSFPSKSPMKEVGKSILSIPVFTSQVTQNTSRWSKWKRCLKST